MTTVCIWDVISVSGMLFYFDTSRARANNISLFSAISGATEISQS